MKGLILSSSVVLAAVASIAYYYCLHYPRQEIPSHLLNHKAFWIEDFLTNESSNKLNRMMRDMAVFPSNVDDLKSMSFIPRHESIGEAQLIEEGGTLYKTRPLSYYKTPDHCPCNP